MDYLDPSTMAEAEVSVRLAEYLANPTRSTGIIEVAIDGAQVKVKNKVIFPLAEFLADSGWSITNANKWRGIYEKPGFNKIVIHSTPGKGDVVAPLKSGETLRVESKKGPLTRSKSSKEYPLVREALGQLLTMDEVSDRDILAIAVPWTQKFSELASRWRHAPLISRFGIKLILVHRSGEVEGL